MKIFWSIPVFLLVPAFWLIFFPSNAPLKKIKREKVEIMQRYISIDNVCAWPNLTKLGDGSINASIFNQPSHAIDTGRRIL